MPTEKLPHPTLQALRIRPHGNFHLGQLLLTAGGWRVIDFEGEPSRPLFERRIKSCALIDVASMMRSFAYVSAAGLQREEAGEALEPWAELWATWMGSHFLGSYLEGVGGAAFLPDDTQELSVLLEVFLLQRTLYELDYELNNRPDWVPIPLRELGRA